MDGGKASYRLVPNSMVFCFAATEVTPVICSRPLPPPKKKINVYFRLRYGELVCFAVGSSICIALDSSY